MLVILSIFYFLLLLFIVGAKKERRLRYDDGSEFSRRNNASAIDDAMQHASAAAAAAAAAGPREAVCANGQVEAFAYRLHSTCWLHYLRMYSVLRRCVGVGQSYRKEFFFGYNCIV